MNNMPIECSNNEDAFIKYVQLLDLSPAQSRSLVQGNSITFRKFFDSGMLPTGRCPSYQKYIQFDYYQATLFPFTQPNIRV